ncbi:hypothetical protein C2W62_52920, partial [Candidatus Entotheonella serta]
GWDNRSSSFWPRSSDHFGKHQSGIYMPQGPEFIRCDYPNPLPVFEYDKTDKSAYFQAVVKVNTLQRRITSVSFHPLERMMAKIRACTDKSVRIASELKSDGRMTEESCGSLILLKFAFPFSFRSINLILHQISLKPL